MPARGNGKRPGDHQQSTNLPPPPDAPILTPEWREWDDRRQAEAKRSKQTDEPVPPPVATGLPKTATVAEAVEWHSKDAKEFGLKFGSFSELVSTRADLARAVMLLADNQKKLESCERDAKHFRGQLTHARHEALKTINVVAALRDGNLHVDLSQLRSKSELAGEYDKRAAEFTHAEIEQYRNVRLIQKTFRCQFNKLVSDIARIPGVGSAHVAHLTEWLDTFNFYTALLCQ